MTIDFDDPDLAVILDTSVPSLLCREPTTATFRVKAYATGIKTVRDLLSIPAAELFKRVPTSEGNQRRIREVLNDYGLDLR